jgi:hypothetical protein
MSKTIITLALIAASTIAQGGPAQLAPELRTAPRLYVAVPLRAVSSAAPAAGAKPTHQVTIK